jgi:quercetin dioxygenase-like cupin family protein
MGDYTIKNLKEVEDSATKFGLSPNLEARFPSGELGTEKAGMSYQKLAPGFRVPFGHSHPDQEELYVIVSGAGRIKLDDEVQDVKQWDVIRIAPGVMHDIEAGDEGLEMLAFGAPGPLRGDFEMQQGWWGESPD